MPTTKVTDLKSYGVIKEHLGLKESMKIAPNTTARFVGFIDRQTDLIAIRFHETDIILFGSSREIVLNSGGYRTATTKERMNRFLPDELGVYQEKGKWMVVIKNFEEGTRKEYPFEDHMTLKKVDGVWTVV